MLVVTRKPEEKIVIGKDQEIVVTILKIQGEKVSIGIKAEKNTPIYRYELLHKKGNSKGFDKNDEEQEGNDEEQERLEPLEVIREEVS